jgi:hypothetical protein
MRTLCLALVVLTLGGSSAWATPKARPVPAETKGKSGLELAVVSYDGSVNGELTVDVKNPGKKPLTFIATGLYFVPQGDADSAPQRLGAVGPMQIAGAKDAEDQAPKRVDTLEVPAGATVRVKLDVFCIDSHRPSPTSSTGFGLASTRLPGKLRGTIEARAKVVADEAGGYAAPAAKSRVQSEVWTARDAAWIKLDGEGKQETAKQRGVHPQEQTEEQVRQPVRQPIRREPRFAKPPSDE